MIERVSRRVADVHGSRCAVDQDVPTSWEAGVPPRLGSGPRLASGGEGMSKVSRAPGSVEGPAEGPSWGRVVAGGPDFIFWCWVEARAMQSSKADPLESRDDRVGRERLV